MTKLIFSIDNAADKQLMLAPGRRLNLPVEELETEVLSDTAFWDIIELIKFKEQEANLEEATEALVRKTEAV